MERNYAKAKALEIGGSNDPKLRGFRVGEVREITGRPGDFVISVKYVGGPSEFPPYMSVNMDKIDALRDLFDEDKIEHEFINFSDAEIQIC